MSKNPIDIGRLALTADLREHVKFFQELGIEFLDRSTRTVTRPATEDEIPQPISARIPTVPAEPPVSVGQSRVSQGTESATLFGERYVAEALQPSEETFEAIRSDIGDCTRCPLYQGRTQVVHTEGNREARLMFVGEAPGADEDRAGRPFVGRAGQLLTKIIEAIGYTREDVLIGNINRCRPPGNRPPTKEEANVCKPFLLREISSVQPEAIVVLGNTALHNLIDTKKGITRLRGEFQRYKGIPVMPTYHPAYLLRDPSKKRETWEDLKKVRAFLERKNASKKD
jgi:DNA polymerase